MEVKEIYDHSTFDYWFRRGHICTYSFTEVWMEADHQGGDFNTQPIWQVEKPHSAEIRKLRQNVIRDSMQLHHYYPLTRLT